MVKERILKMKADRFTELYMILVLFLFLLFISIGGYWECHYTKDMVVFEINNNVATLEDNRGNLYDWYMEKDDKFEVGSMVRVYFNTKNTDNDITDDEIERVAYGRN